ncbi:lysylphosphatidylglycerol synthase domain-containing protein [Sphingobacterium yanglingense]|uniref:Lysylphosphatidylglycerol synthase-like protein n=1 Tax=Sphingobacterium yanglingense TaxID=1437280 RepID=A0A4R6WBX6_9SPHI|nr:lysylphosphatidylglycerol synthase domain-containing protein [Sphingobacterium yanglingense]TDQ77029.1 lysylphosphatidylglycerol synthase-like protein [Sphingobacterium yanglingense]
MGKLISGRQLFKVVIILIAIVSIGVFIAHTDFITLKKQLELVGFRFVYILLLTFSAYFIGTIGWWVCLGQQRKKIHLLQLFAIRQVGETLALYNPTSVIAGDLLKAQLLKPYEINQEVALRSVTSSRITATLSQISLFIIAMIWLLANAEHTSLSKELTWIISSVISLLLLIKIALFIALSRPAGHVPVQDQSSIWKKTLTALSITFYNCKIFFQQDKKNFWYSYLLFALHWVIGSMELYLLLAFIGYPIQIMDGLVLDMSIIIIKSVGAAIPGQIGIEELANKITLDMIGVKNATLWVSISILRRFRQLIWCVIGLLLAILLKALHNQTRTKPIPLSTD